jgi:hypothetical protein
LGAGGMGAVFLAEQIAVGNRGWRIHWLVCMRPTNAGNISVTASNPWPVLAS